MVAIFGNIVFSAGVDARAAFNGVWAKPIKVFTLARARGFICDFPLVKVITLATTSAATFSSVQAVIAFVSTPFEIPTACAGEMQVSARIAETATGQRDLTLGSSPWRK